MFFVFFFISANPGCFQNVFSNVINQTWICILTIYKSLVLSEVEYFFTGLLIICISFMKYLFMSVVHLKVSLWTVFIIDLWNNFHVKNTNPPCTCKAAHFFPVWNFLLISSSLLKTALSSIFYALCLTFCVLCFCVSMLWLCAYKEPLCACKEAIAAQLQRFYPCFAGKENGVHWA